MEVRVSIKTIDYQINGPFKQLPTAKCGIERSGITRVRQQA